jgi:hypothetical protein
LCVTPVLLKTTTAPRNHSWSFSHLGVTLAPRGRGTLSPMSHCSFSGILGANKAPRGHLRSLSLLRVISASWGHKELIWHPLITSVPPGHSGATDLLDTTSKPLGCNGIFESLRRLGVTPASRGQSGQLWRGFKQIFYNFFQENLEFSENS